MTSCWYHRYTLEPRGRQGALLKVNFGDDKVGFADLFPWPELGDSPLENHLASVVEGAPSLLMERSLVLALRDAELRLQKKSAFESAKKIKNHYLIHDLRMLASTDLAERKAEGFITLKIKMGRDNSEEILLLSKILQSQDFRVRLDWNAKGDPAVFENLARQLPERLHQQVEFIEDPASWDPLVWKEINKKWPLALDNEYHAMDWSELHEIPFQVLVIKPARQSLAKALTNARAFAKLKVVVTSALDHPVGVAHALRVAGELKERFPSLVLDCGCGPVGEDSAHSFSQQMKWQGPFLREISGVGIGFDSLLGGLSWTPLVSR